MYILFNTFLNESGNSWFYFFVGGFHMLVFFHTFVGFAGAETLVRDHPTFGVLKLKSNGEDAQNDNSCNHFGLGYWNDETIDYAVKMKLMPVNLQKLASASNNFGLRISILFTVLQGYTRWKQVKWMLVKPSILHAELSVHIRTNTRILSCRCGMPKDDPRHFAGRLQKIRGFPNGMPETKVDGGWWGYYGKLLGPTDVPWWCFESKAQHF